MTSHLKAPDRKAFAVMVLNKIQNRMVHAYTAIVSREVFVEEEIVRIPDGFESRDSEVEKFDLSTLRIIWRDHGYHSGLAAFSHPRAYYIPRENVIWIEEIEYYE